MIYVLLIILGSSIGSFIGAFTWRLHNKLNFTTDRSICEHCKHVLSAKDLIPIFSWILLKGKCRYCRKEIGITALLLELTTPILFVASYEFWPQDYYALETTAGWLLFSLWLLVLTGLVSLFVYDIKWMLLPDKIVFPLYFVAISINLLNSILQGSEIGSTVVDMFTGILVGGGLFYILFQVSSGRWIGGGDVKLGFLIGLLLGPTNSLIALIISFYISAIFVFPLMAIKKITRKSKVPFGPFLISGLIISLFWAEPIKDAYLKVAGY